MSRQKPADPEGGKGRPIKLPEWWLQALRDRRRGITLRELGRRVAKVSRGAAPSSESAMSDFLTGKVTTDVLMEAFLKIFPDLPRPVFTAASEEEARLFAQISALRAAAAAAPILTETSENYDADLAAAVDDEDQPAAPKRPGRRSS